LICVTDRLAGGREYVENEDFSLVALFSKSDPLQ
jgi:hypothetical protein